MATNVHSRRSVLAALVAATPAATVLAGGGPSFTYTLGDGSAYSEGCGVPGQNSPCACPVILTGQIEGTFLLSEVPPAQDFQTFAIEDVHWAVTLGEPFDVTGSGSYQRGQASDGSKVQRLTLQLVVDGAELVEYDSGLIPGGGDEVPPVIDVSVNDGVLCYAHGFTVAAGPVNPADVAPPGGDGVVGVLDLLAVLSDWGLSGPRATDIDGSGQVGVGDLLAVLAAWSG